MNEGLPATVTITNMSSEMFNDALFYMELGNNEKNVFSQRRFYRSSIIFFCISVEAWINKLLVHALKRKSNRLKYEQELYEVLTEEVDFMPSGIKLTIYAKFNTHLCDLYNFRINKKSSLYKAIEGYLELADYRNKIIHYSSGNYSRAYDIGRLRKCINDASDIIETLFDELDNVPSIAKVGYPNWFKEKESREI